MTAMAMATVKTAGFPAIPKRIIEEEQNNRRILPKLSVKFWEQINVSE